MKKKYLLSPGPVQVPPEVLLTLAEPLLHHRTPQFEEIFSKTQELLQELFQVKSWVLTFASSGTGAMEAAVANLHKEGEKVIVVRGGKFGERWGKIAERFRLKPVYLDIEWGTAPSLEDIERLLKEHPDAASLLIQYSETSTATMYDVPEIAKRVRETSTLLIVDAISALGVVPIDPEGWGIDALVGGSQKSLMLPPGLSFLWLSERAWEKAKESNLPRFYFDVWQERKALEKKTTAFTPSISLIRALYTSLSMMKEYGWEKLYERNYRFMKALHAALDGLRIPLFSKSPSVSVTAGVVPEGIDGKKLVSMMKDVYGVTVAGGQEHLKGKIFRIGTMGYIDESDLVVAIATLEASLYKLGYKFSWGAGVSRLEEVLYS